MHDAATAELAVALTLAARRRLPDFVRAGGEGRWASGWSTGLADARVLIVGYGSIGAAIERRLAGFEVEIHRVARSARPGVRSISEISDMLPQANVVILSTPLTPETESLSTRGRPDRRVGAPGPSSAGAPAQNLDYSRQVSYVDRVTSEFAAQLRAVLVARDRPLRVSGGATTSCAAPAVRSST